jgi:hypothetical protein
MEVDTIYLIAASAAITAWSLAVIIYVNCRVIRQEAPQIQPPHDWVNNLNNPY